MVRHLYSFFTSRNSLAIGTAFFILGFLFGNWATLIPFVKSRFQIDDGILGLILLCMPLGAMAFNPFAAILIQKFSIQRMTISGMIIISFAYMLPLLVYDLILLPLSLIFVGISMTLLNISANTSATNFERFYNKNILATCHGMFSVGLMIGSLMRSFTLLFQINESNHMIFMGGLALLLSLITGKVILNLPDLKKEKTENHPKSVKMLLPSGSLLGIVIISLCINMTEGSITDWASVYMKEIVHSSPFFVGWGLFGYSFFMAIGRFFGDGIIPVYGKNSVLVYGGCLALIGLIIVIFFPTTLVAILGFAFIGLGVSCGSPILYGSASRYPGLPDSGGLAVMNTYAMGGFLMGPVIIGSISNVSSLQVAFGFIVLLTVVWMLKSRIITLY